MTEYDNTNRGVLFRDENPKSEKAPSHTGTLNVNGTEYRVAAWVKVSKAGNKFFSLSVSPKDEKPQNVRPSSAERAAKPAPTIADMTDDIPF